MEVFETEYVSMWIDGGIMYTTYKKNLVIDMPIAEKIIKDRAEFTKGGIYPILIDFSNLKSVTKEARDYMNDPEGGLKGLLGGAFLSSSVATTLFVNLYLKINQPTIPAKFFTNKEEAISWLKKLMVKEKNMAK
jgi:hypothetical protein